MKKIITLLTLLSIAVFAQQQGTFTDSRDKKKYKTVKIGKQTWMAENLNFNAKGSKCYIDTPSNCQKYGRLYDWETAKAVCPKGWHLPSKNEYEVLYKFVGGEEVAGKKLRANRDWNDGGNGTDEFGFSALPGGACAPDGGCEEAGDRTWWWSNSERFDDEYDSDSYNAYDLGMGYDNETVYWGTSPKSILYSVRCVKD